MQLQFSSMIIKSNTGGILITNFTKELNIGSKSSPLFLTQPYLAWLGADSNSTLLPYRQFASTMTFSLSYSGSTNAWQQKDEKWPPQDFWQRCEFYVERNTFTHLAFDCLNLDYLGLVDYASGFVLHCCISSIWK